MLLFTLLMGFSAMIYFVLGLLIYRGRADLIHSYHQHRVTDKEGYCRAYGITMMGMAAGMAVSGGLSLFGVTAAAQATAILICVVVVGALLLAAIQKKYNGGLF